MTNKMIEELLNKKNVVRGYVYPHEGYRKEFWFEESPTNIANFIMHHADAREIILTNTSDELILNTIGCYINSCPELDLLKQILKHLIPMQNKKQEPQEFPIATYEQINAYYNRCDEMDCGI